MTKDIQIKRVYEPASEADGARVLVDRVWPRGMTKEKVQAVEWLKEAAPSTGLRKQFHHDTARWEEFKKRYFAELDANPAAVERLLELAGGKRLTLLYSAKDEQFNQAAALRDYLIEHVQR